MIVYTPFWETLKRSNESTYTLIKVHHISSSIIDRLRNNKPITTTTINDLCFILGCRVEDIMAYTACAEDQIIH
ncbi:MAG: helix-turn-helix transcriptional regulator [Anaerolineaceae bacterium]|nr:helix-turn-helix transcriptional regulator [Anaerolineaceae bacterium]